MVILSRRRFLYQLGSLGPLAAWGSLQKAGDQAWAQAAVDYKALVCIFLFGGNDANNMVIPYESAEYQAYLTVRGASSGVNIPQASLLPLSPPQTRGIRYGLHPNLTRLHQVWQSGRLAILCNVGSLAQPLTKAQYQSRTVQIPDNLFSHSDQQNQWQSAVVNGLARTGWGGRIADALRPLNGQEVFPFITSTGGSVLFSAAVNPSSLAIPTSGTFGLSGYSTSATSAARLKALNQLLAVHGGNELIRAANQIGSISLINSSLVNSVINSNPGNLQSLFASPNDSISKQLFTVAKMIDARSQNKLKRQIFFCSLGGFDTHTDQLRDQGNLFAQLDSAMKGFYDAIVSMGISTQVSAFTLSDFGRTFRPSAGQGSDHGWGSHHLIMGGAVRGGDFYGQYPSLTLNGPDDSSTQGRWIPTTSIDQYAATLASWFGVASADLAGMFPNLMRFPVANLGFLG